MRKYELMWIVGGDLNDTTADDSINEVKGLLEKNQGLKIDNISRWSHRKLSYPIEEFDNGTYFIAVFESEPSSLKNLDNACLLYTSPSPRDGLLSRMPSSA